MRLRTLLTFAAISTAAFSSALTWNITSILSGSQEVPPNSSPATGIATGTLDDVSGMLHFDVNASGFLAPITAAHIHTAPIGSNGPVTFPLTGATGGTTYSSSDMFMLTPAQVSTLLAGGMYVNIHSQVLPGGEIRGQLAATPVPEPGSILALTAGAAMLWRRRRKA
jgi:hypothetical protein